MEPFEEFYLEAKDPCFRAIMAITRNSDEAYELLAAAFEKALSNWSALQSHANKHGWIVKTAANLYRDEWRKKSNFKSLWFAAPFSYENSFDSLDRELLKRIRSLPEQQRTVLAYRILLDLSVEETADLMEIASSTVSVHLRRALATLRGQLEEENWREHA